MIKYEFIEGKTTNHLKKIIKVLSHNYYRH